MEVAYLLDNIQLRTKVRNTLTGKITSQTRINDSITEIVYNFTNKKEKEFCDSVLGAEGIILNKSIAKSFKL